MLGERVGPYTVLRKIGEGGMGGVYEAEHGLLGRRAAIKVLHPTMSANEDVVARFFNEARATTAIADPGIVQIFDFGHHVDGSAYIVMELLAGESMATRLARIGRMSARDAFRLLAQVATSLDGAHARGVVHRDLKPDNIFIVGDPAVTGGERTKILDFGIAKLADGDPRAMKTRTGALIGTPLFMSPEQCRGLSSIDHRADVYSFGCMLYLSVTGYVPFDGEGVGDIMFAHIGSAPRRPSTIVPLPPIVDDIILTCMAKRPADRFASMGALLAAMTAAEPILWHAPPVPVPAAAPAAVTVPMPAAVPTNSVAVMAAPSAITTFSAASGQPMRTPTGVDELGPATTSTRRRGFERWLVGAVAALASLGIVGAVAFRGGDGGSSRSAAKPAASETGGHAEEPPVDAGTDAAHLDAAPPIDATPDARPAPVVKQPPPTTVRRGRPRKQPATTAPIEIDRGD